MPKISVIMPAYNAEKYIAEAIESILGQTFGDFEFIILNDCSTDRTEEIICSYPDPRIVYLKNTQNMGVAATLNKGLSVAKGEYIARMDADDISLPERFEKQMNFMENNPDLVACGSAIKLFGEEQKEMVLTFPTDPIQAQLQLIFSPCFAHPSVMMRKGVLERHSLCYNLRWEGTEDYAFWWELGKYGDICALSECLLHYRIHPQQVTANSNHKIENVFIPFARKRLEDLEIDCELQDAKALFAYTSGKLLPAQAERFVRLMGMIAHSQQAKLRSEPQKLKRFLSTEVLAAVEGLDIPKEEKVHLYRQIKREGFSIGLLRIRKWCSRTLRRVL